MRICKKTAVGGSGGSKRPLGIRSLLAVAILLLVTLSTAFGEYYQSAGAHHLGNLHLGLGRGMIGSGAGIDPITGDTAFGCIYPGGSRKYYFVGKLQIGAPSDKDTLVSAWTEFDKLPGQIDNFIARSLDISSPRYSDQARSELDLITVYNDSGRSMPGTIGADLRPHIPLGVEIRQHSMSWSGASIDDFVLIDYEVTNISQDHLQDVFVSIHCQPRAFYIQGDTWPPFFPLTGYLNGWTYEEACPYYDTLNIAYAMDNNGDPIRGSFTNQSPQAAVGIMLLATSADSLRLNYNWWIGGNTLHPEFGPRRRATLEAPFRLIGPGLGYPYKDVNTYYVMSHPEFDYDQMFTAVDHSGEGWLPPPPDGDMIASGQYAEFMISFGPFDVRRRERFEFTIAVVGGDNVHNDPYAHFDPYNPQLFYDQLDFSELATNARWAQWVYDNPGYDTDSDGYAGEFHICEGDTIWYKGDGVPDFRGNTPPPAPFTRIFTEHGRIIIRWNGYLAETTKDPFSNLVDFEGYRVYSGLDTRRASLSILTSYDRENFFRLKWHDLGSGHGKWLNDEPPYTLEELQIIHNDPSFDPLRYDRVRPLIETDSVFYFEMVDANLDDLSSPFGIHKVYPDATDPGTDSTLWTENDVTHDHGRALPKYYEYEYVLDNMLPTVPYFVSVTSFDFGYAGGRGNLPPDESNPLNNLTECYAQTSADSVEAYQLDAYVYPNPYRADADYHERGYENRAGRIIPDRARLLHFGNLPNVCKISIFSLDGDLIGSLDHNFPEGGPEAMHDWWNLVSRNGLAVESGLYYFVVESATRTQIGKFVILK